MTRELNWESSPRSDKDHINTVMPSAHYTILGGDTDINSSSSGKRMERETAKIQFQSHSCTAPSNPAKTQSTSIGCSQKIQNDNFLMHNDFPVKVWQSIRYLGRERRVNLSIHIIISSWSHMERDALLTQIRGCRKAVVHLLICCLT